IHESIFKGLGRALRMAVTKDGTDSLPSTKGVLE
ncbi:MAG TPA: imidazoleglycerol-phosphate dehydratase, partial [Leptospiraceae bacterium]|nr:imidazoleglycerol-phosphate dehydratase [Leptospiraceae bacterium]